MRRLQCLKNFGASRLVKKMMILDRFKFKVVNTDTNKIELGSFFINDETGELYKQELSWCEIEIKPVEFNYRILASTDLQDKNGKLIYEGDIVSYEDKKYTIDWSIEKAGFRLRSLRDIYDFFYGSKLRHMELVGNIYDNPDLLEKL